jgi:hypothetical protein
MLVQNRKGQYSFIKGIAPYSGGVVARPGHEVVHVRFARALPWREGFQRIEKQLGSLPKQSLCSVALRSPKPFSFGGFNEFNQQYVEMLKRWDLLVDGLNPVARTNVAPVLDPPGEVLMHSFGYIAPSEGAAGGTFIVAGGGELPEGSLDPHDMVRRGETSPDALAEKARFVMGLMEGRLKELGAGWSGVTATQIYTAHPLPAVGIEAGPSAGRAVALLPAAD